MGATKGSEFFGPNPRAQAAIADDDEDSRTLLSCALRREGYDVFEARDGAELLAHCEALIRLKKPLDLVISDIGMPGCDGVNATRALLSQCPVLPVILLTGFKDEKIWRAAFESGARMVLAKPVRVSTVIRAVITVMA